MPLKLETSSFNRMSSVMKEKKLVTKMDTFKIKIEKKLKDNSSITQMAPSVNSQQVI